MASRSWGKLALFAVAGALLISVAVAFTLSPYDIWVKNRVSLFWAGKSCPTAWDFVSLNAPEGYNQDRSTDEFYRASPILLDDRYLRYPSALKGDFDGRGGRDTLGVKGQGYVNLDARRVTNIEILKAANGEDNIINVLASGLANAEDNEIAVTGDKGRDTVYLDGCLSWDIPQSVASNSEFPAAWRFLAKDKTGKTAAVEIDKNLKIKLLSPKKISAWASGWNWTSRVALKRQEISSRKENKKERLAAVKKKDAPKIRRDNEPSIEEKQESARKLKEAITGRTPYVQKSCNFDQASVQGTALYFPVIVEGKFEENTQFKTNKIYKGYRNQEIIFDDKSFKNAQPVPGRTYLVLAEYKNGKAEFGACSKLYSMDNLESDSFQVELLAELAVYEATAAAKPDIDLEKADTNETHGSRSNNYKNLYALKSDLLKKYNDYLYLMEISGKLIVDAAKQANKDGYKRQEMPHFRLERVYDWSVCSNNADVSSIYLPQEIKDALSGLIIELGGHSSSYGSYREIFQVAVSDYAYGLMRLGEFESAAAALCPADNGPLYLEAALKANKPELVNGKIVGRVRILSNLDLSHLVLKRLDAYAAEWESLDVSGTDLTNTKFNAAKIKNVNLQQAKLYLATYDCKTEFPEGFDPVQNHMIFDGDGDCAEKQHPFFNLDNVVVNTYYSGAKNEYDESKLHIVNLTGGTAKNAKLGTVDCFRCKIIDSDFSGSQIALRISEGEIRNTSFRNADLKNSGFPQMEFTNVDFTGADLTDVHLRGVYYDSKTIWPEGFDPQAAGATKKPE